MSSMKKLLIYLSLTCGIVGSFSWWYFQAERVVKRRVLSLIADLSVAKDAGRAARLLKGDQVAKFLSPEVELETTFDEIGGTLSRESIASGYSFVAEKASSISIVPLEEMTVVVNEDQAEVKLLVQADAAIGGWIKPVNGKYTVEISWKKTDDGWLITKSRWTEARGR